MIARTTQQLFLDLAATALRGGLIRRASRSLGEHVRSPSRAPAGPLGIAATEVFSLVDGESRSVLSTLRFRRGGDLPPLVRRRTAAID
jgi:hypothetical protein